MPAYRSTAEADIRAPVVERLREIIPGCRIIHEINAASFGNRIDVLAVGEDRIAAVEIKSAKDKLDRLPEQIKAMRSVSNMVFSALHERFLDVHGASHYPPHEANGAIVWAWPVCNRLGHVQLSQEWIAKDPWRKSSQCLPPDAIGMLWRNELQDVCAEWRIKGARSLTMGQAVDHIRWRMTGEEITRLICSVLRKRVCVEADAPCQS